MPLRLMPVLVGVPILCVLALIQPFWGVLGYTGFALLRPDILAWSEGQYPFSAALAGATIAGCIPRLGRLLVLITNPVALGLVVLQMPIWLSVANARVYELAIEPYGSFARLIFMALLIPVFVVTLEQLRWLFLTMAVAMGILGIKYGLIGLVFGASHITYGHGGFMSDNNTLALAIVMTLPLLWHGSRIVKTRRSQVIFLFMLLTSLSAIVVTHSRGAAIATVVVLLWTLLHARRKVVLAVAFLVLAAPSFYLARESYFERLGSMTDEDQQSGEGSRLALARTAFRVWQDHPWLGVGWGTKNYRMVVGSYSPNEVGRVCHNNWMQVLADGGILTFVPYVALMSGVMIWLGISARRPEVAANNLSMYPIALQSALLGFAAGSTFLSRVDFDYYYMLLMTAAAWWHISRGLEMPEETEDAGQEAGHPQAAITA